MSLLFIFILILACVANWFWSEHGIICSFFDFANVIPLVKDVTWLGPNQNLAVFETKQRA